MNEALQQTISILVVEDDPGDFGLIRTHVLLSGLSISGNKEPVTWARTLAEGIAAARSNKPDIVLLDLSLPDSSGLVTVQVMRTALPDIPIVVLTGHDDSALAVTALQAGAQDYLVKGQFDHDALGRAVRNALVRGALESRLRLSDLALNSVTDGIVITDINASIQWANPAFTQLTGFSLEEALGRNPGELVKSGKHDQAFYQNMWKTILSGQAWHGEIINRRKNGSLYDGALIIAPVIDGDGTIQRFVATMQDITERKRTEAELRDSEERFRQLFEKAPIGIAMARQDQKIFLANDIYCRMYGYTQEELRHLTITDLTHPEYRDQTRHLATSVLEGEIPVYSFEKKYLRKDGSTFWGHITATEVRGDRPQTRYIMGIVKDITRRVEQESHRLAEVKEQKDMLVREVHHRIKNNLQGVVGLLRQYGSDHPAMADVIDVAIGRIYSIAIIHGLQAKILTEEVELTDLIESITNASGCSATYENQLTCLVFLNKDDAVPIALALNELITNAYKHRSANSPVIIRLKLNEPYAVITIVNHFDRVDVGLAEGGQGLHLVRSLLPKKSANFLVTQAGNVFSVELKLAQPVVIFDSHINSSKRDRQ